MFIYYESTCYLRVDHVMNNRFERVQQYGQWVIQYIIFLHFTVPGSGEFHKMEGLLDFLKFGASARVRSRFWIRGRKRIAVRIRTGVMVSVRIRVRVIRVMIRVGRLISAHLCSIVNLWCSEPSI